MTTKIGDARNRAIPRRVSAPRKHRSPSLPVSVTASVPATVRRYVTVQTASEISGESVWTWRQRAYDGLIASVKPAGPQSRLLIPLDEIERFLAAGLRPAIA